MYVANANESNPPFWFKLLSPHINPSIDVVEGRDHAHAWMGDEHVPSLYVMKLFSRPLRLHNHHIRGCTICGLRSFTTRIATGGTLLVNS
jgi:hypothetical protein